VEELTYRPARNRRVLTTLEVCVNKTAGPYGSVELIVSNPRYEHPTFYFWPLDDAGHIDEGKYEDFSAVVLRECSETLLLQVHGIEMEIPGLET
jgi:hypothetical protein